MDTSNKITGAIVVAVLLVGAGYLVLNAKTDRAKFDQLRVGMTIEEVEDIVGPRPRRVVRLQTEEDKETLEINGVMVLTIRDDKLVDKKWIAEEKGH